MRLKTLLTVAALCVATPTFADDLRFVALGDMPYGKPKKIYAPYEALIGAINDRCSIRRFETIAPRRTVLYRLTQTRAHAPRKPGDPP